MAGAPDRARTLVRAALDQRPVVVRAPILDRVHGPGAVEHADLEILPLHQAHLARLQLRCRAHVDDLRHAVLSPSELIGFAVRIIAERLTAARPRDLWRSGSDVRN